MVETGVFIVASLIFIALAALYLWSISWAISDAQKRGQTGCLPMLFFWMFGPLAIIAWFLFRPKKTLVNKHCSDYQNAEDALSSASRLDIQGDWDTAIELYRFTAKRWPEHESYAEQCVERIKTKQLSS